MHSLPPTRGGEERADVPWWRVINSQGRVSTGGREHGANVQQELLEAEGVEFDERGYVDWERFGWEGLTWQEVQDLL
jgi:methylated-DNA-protein-cysteine methyltransferase-like protein